MALKSGRVGIHPSQVDPITGMLLNGPTPGSISFEDLSDAQISNPEIGQTLQYNGTGWENVFASISPVTPATLASLQDVMLSDLQDGDFISYDATEEKWVNVGEAPAPTYTDLTVTMYGAVEDTISFTDAAGISHSEVFASGQSSKSVTFKINPSGSTSITFTSAVAKNPDDLTADYSKSITITDATTEIKVMPDNALYWYGYIDNNLEEVNSTNGWSNTEWNYTYVSPTYNTNNMDINVTGTLCGVGNKNAISGTTGYMIAQGVTLSGSFYGTIRSQSNKNITGSSNKNDLESSSVTTLNVPLSSYLSASTFRVGDTRRMTLYALWYE